MNYPFKILIVKKNNTYSGRVVYQDGSPSFSVMIKNNEYDDIKVTVTTACFFEFGVDNSGGTLFLRGSTFSSDHRTSDIRACHTTVELLASRLNESLKQTLNQAH